MTIRKASEEAVRSACQGVQPELAEFIADQRRELELQYDEAKNINHDLADVLRALEWDTRDLCPWCLGTRPNHTGGPCKLKIMIDKGYIPNKPQCECNYKTIQGAHADGCPALKRICEHVWEVDGDRDVCKKCGSRANPVM